MKNEILPILAGMVGYDELARELIPGIMSAYVGYREYIPGKSDPYTIYIKKNTVPVIWRVLMADYNSTSNMYAIRRNDTGMDWYDGALPDDDHRPELSSAEICGIAIPASTIDVGHIDLTPPAYLHMMHVSRAFGVPHDHTEKYLKRRT